MLKKLSKLSDDQLKRMIKADGWTWKTIVIVYPKKGRDRVIDLYTKKELISECEVRRLIRGGKTAQRIEYKSFRL